MADDFISAFSGVLRQELFTAFLPQPPKCCGYRCELLSLARFSLLNQRKLKDFLCRRVLSQYVCVPSIRLVPAESREAVSPLELELQMVVNCQVGTEN